MKSLIAPAALHLLACTLLQAQSDYRKHSITLGVGAARPRGDVRTFFTDSPALAGRYGYRFHRYFQIDAGLDTVFGAADVRDFMPTQFGDLRIRDYQFLLPYGGTVIVPLAGERVHFSASGGGAYARYSEQIRQPFQDSGFRLDCVVCSSRQGWGYYAGLGANVALDQAQNFRLGVGSRVYRVETEGDPFGSVPGIRTRDRWINLFVELTFSL